MNVGRLAANVNPNSPRKQVHGGISNRRSTGEAGKCGITLYESVGWFQLRMKYTAYTMAPASSMPLTRLHSLRRRHLRRPSLPAGKSAAGLILRLKMNPRKQNSNKPDENFESSAPANANPNFTTDARVGFCHMSASVHIVSREKSVIAMSVKTR